MPKFLSFVPTSHDHNVTTLELFFDLVFVFALTQVTALVAHHPTPAGFAQGFITLALLWLAWASYSWLGNQAKADEGALRAALIVAMAAMFVCALAIPNIFQLPGEGFIEPWLFAIAYAFVRFAHLVVYFLAAENDAGLRRQLAITSVPVSLACIMLIAGSFLSAEYQFWCWVCALLIDYGGIWIVGADGWRLPAPKHFAERYGLIIIVALGESLVATGVGIGEYELTMPVVIGATLALALTVCLWWLYFDVVALVAERILAKKEGQDRARLGRDSYTYLHFPMLIGIVLLAVGLKKTMGAIAEAESVSLSWTAAAGLCLGPAVYLLAHIGFRYRNMGTINKQRTLVTALLCAVLPVCVAVGPILALAIVTAIFILLVLYEVRHYSIARDKIRHFDHHQHAVSHHSIASHEPGTITLD